MRNKRIVILVLIILHILQLQVLAVIRLAPVFSQNMVIQRDKPIQIWGTGIPNETVEVWFGSVKKQIFVNADSAWTVTFPKQKANVIPQSLIVNGENQKIVFGNILIGDVWICSGQSNMEWPMQKEMYFKEEVGMSNQTLIRLNNPSPAGRYVYGEAYTDSLNKRLNSRDFYRWESWQSCGSNTFRTMSAVGYYFAKSIVSHTGVPIGIVNLSIGGAPIETFISRDAMENSKQFAVKVKKGNWLDNPSLSEWIRIRARQNVGGNPYGFQDELGLNHAYKPGFAYEGGIKPLLPFAVKGVILYQGESNSLEQERVDEYRDLLHLMISDYRHGWQNPQLPFYWVQLSSIDTVTYQSRFWPQFRNEQRKLLDEVKNCGMAVCSDIGLKNNVHPTNKKDVGERLARWALNGLYGINNVPSGPLPIKANFKNGKLVISFNYSNGLKTSDGKMIRGFSLDGKTEITATIVKNKIVIRTAIQPLFVYYAWKPFTEANLVNSRDLPASTFKINIQ